ncbi:MAG: hypothetical protein J3Q66DRAFT_41940 [Benniella sp.]|nr:MAG: hypothetical protein J3Q66DRAFT_41940 [Benniella sp.]
MLPSLSIPRLTWLALVSWVSIHTVAAWPYIDCSGPNPIFAIERATAHYDRSNNTINLLLQGNFTNSVWAQGYSEAATSQWRTSIQTTIMGTQLYRSEGPACMAEGGMVIGGCPTKAGSGIIQASFNISQSAPFAELMVAMQIVANNSQPVACLAILLEQTMPQVDTALSYLPLGLAVLSGGISLVATIIRASVGNGFLNAVASYGLPTEAISVHTPGFFDIVFYTQFMLMTGQLSINYPSYYSTFTSLFHWSFLAFADTLTGKGPTNATDVLTFGGAGSVNQIKNRVETTGNNTRTNISRWSSSSEDALEKRSLLQHELLPHEFSMDSRMAYVPAIGTKEAAPLHLLPRQDQPDVLKRAPPTSTSPSNLNQPSASRPPTPSATGSLVIPTIVEPFDHYKLANVSRFGMESYAAAIGAFPSSLFLGTLINAALVAGGSLVISAVLMGVAWVMAKENHQRGKTLYHASNFVAGNLLRVWYLLFTPLSLSAMYQLTISGNIALIIASAASLLIVSVSATIFFTWRILRASSGFLLYDDQGTLLKYGTLYNTLSKEGSLFFLVTLLVRFLWGLSIAMLSAYGIAQVAILLSVEFAYVIVISVKWPYAESGDNKFHMFLGIIRIVITGCLIAYVHDLEASPDVRHLFAYIQMALHLAVFIVIFALVLWNFIQVCLYWRMRHSDSWRGPIKTYNFDDPVLDDGIGQGWGGRHSRGPPGSGGSNGGHSRGIMSHRHDSEDGNEFDPVKSRSFTVMPYSAMRGSDSLPTLHAPSRAHLAHQHHHYDSSDEETPRYGSPAERYRQLRLVDSHRSRFIPPSGSEGGGSVPDEAMQDRRLDSLIPLTAAAGGLGSGRVTPTSRPHSQVRSSGDMDDSPIMGPSALRHTLPQRESYANLQRMSHQQTAAPVPTVTPTPNLRTRRMSDITRDGPYVYHASKEEQDYYRSSTSPERSKGGGLWAGLKTSLGGALRFGKKSSNAGPIHDSLRSRGFEVMRPRRRNTAEPDHSFSGSVVDDTSSQAGGNQLRELNAVGMYTQSDRGYEQNRKLIVANPSAMISRTGSLLSTVSGALAQNAAVTSLAASGGGKLHRHGSEVAESIRSLPYTRSRGVGPHSAGFPHGPGAAAQSGFGERSSLTMSVLGGVDSSVMSEHGGTVSELEMGSRRTSAAVMSAAGTTASQLYPSRHSADSSNNIAEALNMEAPVLLQGGGILRVSKGPEKAVRYHKESRQYVESIAESLKDERAEAGNGSVAETPASTPASTPVVAPVVSSSNSKSAAASETLQSHPPVIKTHPSQPTMQETAGQDQKRQQQQQMQERQQERKQQQQQQQQQQASPPLAKKRSIAESSTSAPSGASAPESPTESQESPTATQMAASAGRMQEILGRMFSDRSVRVHSDHDPDSDSMMSEDTNSTFSLQLTQQQQQQQQPPIQSALPDDDPQSSERYIILEPLLEDSDPGSDSTVRQSDFTPSAQTCPSKVVVHDTDKENVDSGAVKRSSSSGTEKPKHSLMRTSSGGLSRPHAGSISGGCPSSSSQPGLLKPRQNSAPSNSRRPLAQSPLHSPSVQLTSIASASATSGNLSRQSSTHSNSGGAAPGPGSGSGSGSGSGPAPCSKPVVLEFVESPRSMEPGPSPWHDNSTVERQNNFLNRNPSIATARTDSSYTTAKSEYPSDNEDNDGQEEP